jgi:hypothetical protein
MRGDDDHQEGMFSYISPEQRVPAGRQSGVAVYLHRSCLQPVPIEKPDGQNMTRTFDSATLNR